MTSFDPKLITFEHVQGGAMGPHYMVKYNGDYLGHFYPDTTNTEVLDAFIEQFEV